MTYWQDKRVLVTGGAGFLGRSLLATLRSRGVTDLLAPTSRECDLTDPQAVERTFSDYRPHTVIHCAGRVGGIAMNRAKPGEIFYVNLLAGVHAMEYARRCGAEKFVGIGTVCAYPKHTPVPFSEDALWLGYPEETNAPYGLSKKNMLVQALAYREQYGFSAVNPILVNLYGPGDDFSLHDSHVVPALIRKVVEAKETGTPLSVWGSGTASREFLFVEDAALGIALAAERLQGPEPVNLGSGMEITIRDLVALIAKLVGFDGPIEYDSSKPDGQPRRCLDVNRAREQFGFTASTPFEEGLRKTIAWYQDNREAANAGKRAPTTP